MSLPDILLSLLREPMSGTELVEIFQGTINHFWKTDLSQIYKALEALEREECLTSRTVPSSRGPERRVYSLTATGRKRLRSWIHRPPRIPAAKFEYLAQLFSVTAEREPRQAAGEMLTSMRGKAAREVAVLEGLDALFTERPGYPESMPSSLFYPWLTLRHGLLRRRALLAWIDEALQFLEARSKQTDEGSGRKAISELMEALKEFESESPQEPT